MTAKFTLVVAVAVTALAVGAPSAFGQDRLADAHDRSVATAPDWFERAALAAQRNGSVVSTYPDSFERAALAAQRDNGLVAYSDGAQRVEPTTASATAPIAAGSDSAIDPTQIGIGFGIGLLVFAGLLLATRLIPRQPLLP